MITIMKRLPKIFGLQKLIQIKKLDERGFVFLEFVIGLPLMIILILSMSNLFINTFKQCKDMVADFILQQEMQSALVRIIDDAKIAYNVEITKLPYNRVQFWHQQMTEEGKIGDTDETKTGKPWYKSKDGKIYRNGESSPITGDDFLSDTSISFEPKLINDRLLYIRMTGKSRVSGHSIVLTTEVFMKGCKNE